jgi:alpha-D-ribose 1-methylphosphonate 5-triphosphate synthase subunit PhnL
MINASLEIMIRAEKISKSFILHNQGGIVLPVMNDVSFSVAKGECLVLSGPSGAGKSTLLRILYANYKPTTGHVFIRHHDATIDIVNARARDVLAVRRNTVSYVSQFLRVIPRVTTLDIVKDPMLRRNVDEKQADDRAKTMLERLNLPERLWLLPPSTFSGGEQQRVNIARSFVDPTPIMLLDEPTASLDACNRHIVMDLITATRQSGAAIVGIFHDEIVRDAVATRFLDLSTLQSAA